jgi:hypothetical protein
MSYSQSGGAFKASPYINHHEPSHTFHSASDLCLNPDLLSHSSFESTVATLLLTKDSRSGLSVSPPHNSTIDEGHQDRSDIEPTTNPRSLPPRYPLPESSSSHPPPFSSLYCDTPTSRIQEPNLQSFNGFAGSGTDATRASRLAQSCNTVALGVSASSRPTSLSGTGISDPAASTADQPSTEIKGAPKEEDTEPPPAYSEGSSPLQSFTYVMATAGGPSSIITQVQQGGPPNNALGGQYPAKSTRLPCASANLTEFRCWVG